MMASLNNVTKSFPFLWCFQRCLNFLGHVASVASVSHMLQSSIGSSCPKSPTRIIEMSPNVLSLGSRPRSLKYALLPCCVRICMRAINAVPMKEISSMISRSTSCQVSSNFRKAAPSSSIFHAALGKTWKDEQAVRAPNPMLNAATPVYAVSSTFAGTFLQGRGCHKVETPLIGNSSATKHIHNHIYIKQT